MSAPVAFLEFVEEHGPLTFAEFMEWALYDQQSGYYSGRRNPVGREGDFITAPHLSPVFAYGLSRMVNELLQLRGDGLCAIVDIGCGDGSLLHQLSGWIDRPLRLLGVDRFHGRVSSEEIELRTEVPALAGDGFLVANELYDSFPVRRVVQREEGLAELLVEIRDGSPAWLEVRAGEELEQYLGSRGVRLEVGQFADFSLRWGESHRELLDRVGGGLSVVVDYGNEAGAVFDVRSRRWGSVASYRGHQVSRDVLREPGRQDITAHVNFSDLMAAGTEAGWSQLFFGRLAPFLLSLGAADHAAFRSTDYEERENARRLILPDGLGEEMMVLVQGRGVPLEGWSFQKKLW